MKKILLACLIVLFTSASASAEAIDLNPAPPHTQRLTLRAFHVDKEWYIRTKDQQCPGRNNSRSHYDQQDGSVVVNCGEDTYFSPEVPNIPNPVQYLQSINPSQTPAKAQKYQDRTIKVTKTVTRTQTVPIRTITKRVPQNRPIFIWSLLLIACSLAGGFIIGSIFTLVRKLNDS